MIAKLARVAGFTLTILAVLALFVLIFKYEFPASQYTGTPVELSRELVKADTEEIGLEVSWFLWNYRVIDLIAQAFVLFATATCCIALLRIDEEREV